MKFWNSISMVFEGSKKQKKYQANLILASDELKRNYNTEMNLGIEF